MAYNYIYALTYVDYDNENKDVMYFNNDTDKDTYFNLTSLFDSSNKKYFNFEKKNLIDIKLEIDNTETNEINEEFGVNYLIIKEVNTSFYYFYFINKISYDNFNKITILAHLDVFTTYFDKLVFEGLINRHTAREFIKDGTDIIYDLDSFTHVFSVDDTYKGKKFLQYDKTLQPHVYTYIDNSTLDTWLEENVKAWQYIFVDVNHQYKYDNITYRNTDDFLSDGISTSFGVLAQPLYLTNNKMYVRFRDVSNPNDPKQYSILISEGAIDQFRLYNNDNSYIYSSKISKQPPFTPILESSVWDLGAFKCSIEINSGNLWFNFGDVSGANLSILLQNYTKLFVTHNISTTYYEGMLEMTFQTNRFYNNNVSSAIQSYYKSRMATTKYLSNSTEFWKYPNASAIKNMELKLTFNGEEYSTSPTKIDTGSAIVEMLEAINTDISKIYVRWKHNGYYAFRSANSKTLTGGIFSDDNLLPLGTSKLQDVLANSKNFFLQKRVNIGANSLLSLANNYVKGDVLGTANTLAKEQLSEINYGFDLDNIENAPSHLDKASGNAMFNMLSKDFGVHLEIWMITMEDLTNIAQYYNRFGIDTNTIGTKFDFLEKHKYFDYVEMDSYYIHGSINISNEIKTEFKRKLKRGVRFWYDKTKLYNYSLYNYERALE